MTPRCRPSSGRLNPQGAGAFHQLQGRARQRAYLQSAPMSPQVLDIGTVILTSKPPAPVSPAVGVPLDNPVIAVRAIHRLDGAGSVPGRAAEESMSKPAHFERPCRAVVARERRHRRSTVRLDVIDRRDVLVVATAAAAAAAATATTAATAAVIAHGRGRRAVARTVVAHDRRAATAATTAATARTVVVHLGAGVAVMGSRERRRRQGYSGEQEGSSDTHGTARVQRGGQIQALHTTSLSSDLVDMRGRATTRVLHPHHAYL